jgi:hypothetical protein
MVTAILSQTIDPLIPGFPMIAMLRIFTGAINLICFGLGISRILSTVRIFEGIVTMGTDATIRPVRTVPPPPTGLPVRRFQQQKIKPPCPAVPRERP